MRPVISLLLFVLSTGLSAVTIVECEDSEGNRSFKQFCAPDETTLTEKKVATRTTPLPTITPIVYLTADCRACDAVRKYFGDRNINIEEKNIAEDETARNELEESLGSLTIPATVIEGKIMDGYKPDTLTNALLNVGYTIYDLQVDEN